MDKSIKEFLDSCPNQTYMDKPFIVRWSRPGVGFGEFAFYYTPDGAVICDNETMTREFVKEVLCDLVDNARFEYERGILTESTEDC